MPVLKQENFTGWTFDSLPELLEVQQGKQTLIGYPALVDKLTHCHIEVFDDPDEAARVHRIGLRRLFALQLKEQVNSLRKIFRVCSKWACSLWRWARRKNCANRLSRRRLNARVCSNPCQLIR
jgi:hypothetical protein